MKEKERRSAAVVSKAVVALAVLLQRTFPCCACCPARCVRYA